MPQGIAVRVADAPPEQFHPGSTLCRLYPSLGMFEHEDNHVVVAVTPAAVDHGLPEPTVFKTDSAGAMSHGRTLDRDAEALAPAQRIVVRHDHEAALFNLSGAGYLLVEPHDLPALRELSEAQAAAFAQGKLRSDAVAARDYAENNWGTFAAMHLVHSGAHPGVFRSSSQIDWS